MSTALQPLFTAGLWLVASMLWLLMVGALYRTLRRERRNTARRLQR